MKKIILLLIPSTICIAAFALFYTNGQSHDKSLPISSEAIPRSKHTSQESVESSNKDVLTPRKAVLDSPTASAFSPSRNTNTNSAPINTAQTQKSAKRGKASSDSPSLRPGKARQSSAELGTETNFSEHGMPQNAATIIETQTAQLSSAEQYGKDGSGMQAPAGLEIELPSQADGKPLIVEILPQVVLPAAIADEREFASPVVSRAREHIIESFSREIQAAVSDPAIANDEAALMEAYKNATKTADAQYRALFGHAAFNSAKMSSAITALKYKTPPAAPTEE